MRHRSQRLDVVDRRRLPEESGDRRKRRLDARIAALSFERIHQRRFFTADVRAGALVDVDVDPLARAHRVLAEDAGGVRFGERVIEALNRLGKLAAYVDVCCLGANRVRAHGAPFDEGVRCPAHDFAILERTRLGFVGIAAEVVRPAVTWFHERPLHAGRETRATATAESGVLDDIDNRRGLHLERLLEPLVATALRPAVERPRVDVAEVLAQQRGFARVRFVRISHYFSPARMVGTLSGVTFST